MTPGSGREMIALSRLVTLLLIISLVSNFASLETCFVNKWLCSYGPKSNLPPALQEPGEPRGLAVLARVLHQLMQGWRWPLPLFWKAQGAAAGKVWSLASTMGSWYPLLCYQCCDSVRLTALLLWLWVSQRDRYHDPSLFLVFLPGKRNVPLTSSFILFILG